MFKEKTFLWYDTETFGLDTKYDRICEFAAVRTNMKLEVVEDPIVIKIKPSVDYIPSYGAMCVTGISPLDLQDGLAESDAINKIKDLFSVSGTIAVGYNTVSYDREILRSSFFRELLDPYSSEYGEGRGTWDIIDLVRMCHDLRPGNIVWPVNDSGKPSFKLTDLTEANGIEHEGAHGALADTLATLNLARLIKKEQPNLFEFVFKLSTKYEAAKFLTEHIGKPVLYTDARFTTSKGCTNPLLILGPDPERNTTFYAINLLNNKTVSALLDQNYKDVELFRVVTNRCPCLSPLTSAKGYEETLGFSLNIVATSAKNILPYADRAYKDFISKPPKSWPLASDVYLSIYDGLFDASANEMRIVISQKEPQEAIKYFPYISNERVKELANRKFCRDYPELMEKEVLDSWEKDARARVLNGLGSINRGLVGLFMDMSMDNNNKELQKKINTYLDTVINKRFPGVVEEARSETNCLEQ